MLENLLNMQIMLRLRTREDKNVVEVEDTKNVKIITKSILHKSLKGGRCICEAIGYNEVFKESKVSPECSFPLITLTNVEVTVCTFEINDSEYFASLDLVQ